MPKPPHKPNPSRKSTPKKPGGKKRKEIKPGLDPNDFDLRALLLFLEESRRFTLGLAYVDSFQTRQTILERLRGLVADRPVFLTVLDLGKFPGEELLLHRLQEHLRENPAPEGKHPAVMVVGLEALLDYRDLGLSPTRTTPQPILRNANIQRDAYPRLVPAAVVLWLLPTASTLFAREAPDLWHWRSGTFEFSGPPDARRDLEFMNVGMPLHESQNLPVTEKRDRIALLRDLLVGRDEGPDQDSPGHLARKAALLNEIGMAKQAVSQSVQAIPDFEAAAEIYRRIGDRRGEGMSLGNLGTAYADLGQMAKAIEYYQQHLVIARELGDRRGEGAALGNLGTAYADLGQAQKAVGYYERTLAIARELGDRRSEGMSLGNLGIAYAELGQTAKAIGYHEHALAIACELGDRRSEGTLLGNLGVASSTLGHKEKAIGYFEQNLSIARELGDRGGEGRALANLGVAHAALGQTEKAIDLLHQALEIGEEVRDPRLIQFCSNALVRLQGGPPTRASRSGQAGEDR